MTGQPTQTKNYTRIAAAIVIAGIVVAASIFVSPNLQPAKTLTTTITNDKTSIQTLVSLQTQTILENSTLSVTSTVTQSEPCASGQLVWNINSTVGVSLPLSYPVLLMQSDSTAYVCVTSRSHWEGNTTTFLSFFGPDINYSQLQEYPGLIIYKDRNGNPLPTHNFITSAYPSSFHFTDTTDFVSIIYTVTALDNSTGFYDNSAPFACGGGMPMAVGYTASQVNASDFEGISLQNTFCSADPLIYFYPYSVSVTGMNLTIIQKPSS